MNIKPVSSPHAIGAEIKTTNNSAAREKAMAAFMKGAEEQSKPAQAIVQNQNAIQPEEMSVVVPKVEAKTEEESDASTTAESSQAVTETQPPKEESTEAEDPALAKQYAQLARAEKALRAKQLQQNQELSKREAEIEAREKALAAKDAQYNQGYISKDILKNNPLRALAEAGISYDDITNQILNTQNVDPRTEATISELKAEIQALKQQNEESSKQRQSEQEKQYKQAVAQIRRDVQRLVDANDDFETIKATGSYDDVVELIEQTYKDEGYIMTNEEAAKMVEDYLIEEALKITKINKIKSKLNLGTGKVETKEVKTQDTQGQQKQQEAPKMKTLTNDAAVNTRPLSAKERAIAAFNGQKVR